MDWREVLYQYLLACAQGIHDGLRKAGESQEIKFMQNFGTPELKERTSQKIHAKIDAEIQPQPPESFKVIEENSEFVIVEIEGKDNALPIISKRFRLKHIDGAWLLDDIYWPCVCGKTNGKCLFCDGTGKCVMCEGSGVINRFWGLIKSTCRLCHGQPVCKNCNGTGLCENCKDSDIPGWKSSTYPDRPIYKRPNGAPESK